MCFGMDTLVTTSSGNQKLMKDLKIGEEVLSDETGSMTKFIGWIELNSKTKNKMIEVETDDGEKLIMSATVRTTLSATLESQWEPPSCRTRSCILLFLTPGPSSESVSSDAG